MEHVPQENEGQHTGRATLDPTGPAAVVVTCMTAPPGRCQVELPTWWREAAGPGHHPALRGGWAGGGAGREGRARDWGRLRLPGAVPRTGLEPSTERPLLQTHGGAWEREPARPHTTAALPPWGWGAARAQKAVWGPHNRGVSVSAAHPALGVCLTCQLSGFPTCGQLDSPRK